MQVHYLEIVTQDVDGVCRAYAGQGAVFGTPVAALGYARTASLADGSLLGVRGSLRDTEAPVVRPYWRVQDLDVAVAAVEHSGGTIAVSPTPIPGYGRFAIYLQGGNDHGLWQPLERA